MTKKTDRPRKPTGEREQIEESWKATKAADGAPALFSAEAADISNSKAKKELERRKEERGEREGSGGLERGRRRRKNRG